MQKCFRNIRARCPMLMYFPSYNGKKMITNFPKNNNYRLKIVYIIYGHTVKASRQQMQLTTQLYQKQWAIVQKFRISALGEALQAHVCKLRKMSALYLASSPQAKIFEKKSVNIEIIWQKQRKSIDLKRYFHSVLNFLLLFICYFGRLCSPSREKGGHFALFRNQALVHFSKEQQRAMKSGKKSSSLWCPSK